MEHFDINIDSQETYSLTGI